MLLELDSLRKAIKSLQAVLGKADDEALSMRIDDITRYAIKAGAIQNFEFTYELCWKFMKRWLENTMGNTYVDGVSRRELYRIAAEHQLIDDVDQWMIYHKARNITSHTYNEDRAEEVFQIAKIFVTDAEKLLHQIEAHND
jgi:nucleotidyltransferase substrate binding protein (TIGR01987 family)